MSTRHVIIVISSIIIIIINIINIINIIINITIIIIIVNIIVIIIINITIAIIIIVIIIILNPKDNFLESVFWCINMPPPHHHHNHHVCLLRCAARPLSSWCESCAASLDGPLMERWCRLLLPETGHQRCGRSPESFKAPTNSHLEALASRWIKVEENWHQQLK